ncbi:hypothetical protein [Algoriphagus halophytocola]|uniref:Uncharacterized protein n=1 Tax=Algoriphagus halophytocola TaxID=2991499 RepID=A0ABY6MEH1_9BACT|nr:hypothetical protein [Algoriphagus sp. TR-M5]UZD22197.1 hypothetical protein OM944_16170 [Algoriphagus sp. TR-M5]
MWILVGLILLGLGVYLYRKVILPDKVGFHKFNYEYKFRRNGSIYLLLIGGCIMVVRELIIWIWFLVSLVQLLEKQEELRSNRVFALSADLSNLAF